MFIRGLRASLLLGLVAAALAHTLASLVLPLAPGFAASNITEPDLRNQLVLITLAAFAAAALWSALLVMLEPGGVSTGVERTARKLVPLVLLPVALPLYNHQFGEDVEEAVILTGFALTLERLVRISLGAYAEERGPLWDRLAMLGRASFSRPRLVLGVLVTAVVAHATFMSIYAVWAHQRFMTFGYDLGQYDQIFQSVLQGQPFRIPSLGYDFVGGDIVYNHADLAALYLLPVYAIWPRAETLLVMQAVLLASAAIPLFLFARRRLPVHWAFVLAVAWLVYPPIHGAQLYDIHMQPFGAAWVMFAIAAADARRWVLYWLFFSFAILCREDVSIGLTMLGAFMVMTGYRVRAGVATALIAVAYFFILRFAVMRHQGFANTFMLLFPIGEGSFTGVLKTMISNPGYTLKTLVVWDKVRYVCQVFAPLVFLPLRQSWLWLLYVPGVILTLLSTDSPPFIQIGFQYVCNWITYIFVGATLVLAAYRTRLQRVQLDAAMVTLVVAMGAASIQWGAYSPRRTVKGGFQEVPFQPPTPEDRQREKDLQALMARVPPGARLCAADRIQAHVTHHLNTWSLRDALYDCEFLLYSDLPHDMGNPRGANAVAAGQYEVIETRPGLFLARKRG